MNRQRRLIDHDKRRSIHPDKDCHAANVRGEIERALELLAPMPDQGPVGPEHVVALAQAYDALNNLDRWLPDGVGYCCLTVNRLAADERGEWISVFSAHQREEDAQRWLERHWLQTIPARDWEIRLMPTRVLDFRHGDPPTPEAEA